MDSRPVIVALDFPEAGPALSLVARLDPALCRVKVGKELFVAEGPGLVAALRERGFEVFLDLKFHDIPHTVAGACRSAARLGAWMINVHAAGGPAMMRAAREALAAFPRPPLLTAVTVLTSLEEAELATVGVRGPVRDQVERLALLAKDCALDGVVCSAREASWIRAATGDSFRLVTPGIRLPSDPPDDQKRTVSPEEAWRLGADDLVVGRPITRAADPLATLRSILRHLPATSGAHS